MKNKLITVVAASMLAMCICAAPAFADILNTSELEDLTHASQPYYPTDVTDIDIDEEAYLPEALSPNEPTPKYEDCYWYGGTYPDTYPTEQEAIDAAKQQAYEKANELKESGEYKYVEAKTTETHSKKVVDQEAKPASSYTEEHPADAKKYDGAAATDFSVPDHAVIGIKQANNTVAFWSAYPWEDQDKDAALDTWKSKDKTSTCEHVVYFWGPGSHDLSKSEGKNLGIYTITFDGTKYVRFTCADDDISHAWAWWTGWTNGVYVPAQEEKSHMEWDCNWIVAARKIIPAPVPPTPVPPTPVDPDPVDPVIPEEPNNDGPTPDNPGRGSDTPRPSVPSTVVKSVPDRVDSGQAVPEGLSYLPKTGDSFGDLDSIFAIVITVCLAAIFLALCRKYGDE